MSLLRPGVIKQNKIPTDTELHIIVELIFKQVVCKI